MLYLLTLVGVASFLFYLYRQTTIVEGINNYNYPNSYFNGFGTGPLGYRKPYQYHATFYNTGINSVPNYNTHSDPNHLYSQIFAYHNNLQTPSLSGYQGNLLNILGTPPLTFTSNFPRRN